MNKVGQLTQTAAYTSVQLSFMYYKPVKISLFGSRLTHKPPEGKSLSGIYDNPVYFFAGYPQIDRFVPLQFHIHPLKAAQDFRAVSLYEKGKGFSPLSSKFFIPEKILQITQEIFFFKRNPVTSGRNFTEQLSLFHKIPPLIMSLI